MEKLLLIVDDDQGVAEILAEIASFLYDRVHLAHTVEDAQKYLSEFVFATVILDINLGGRNGGEVVQYLVSNPNNLNIRVPFVIISGIIGPKFANKFNDKFEAILFKPFNEEEVIEILEDLLLYRSNPVFNKDIFNAECELPFPVQHLEKKVLRKLENIRKNYKAKDIFQQLKINRNEENYFHAMAQLIIQISTIICMELEWFSDKTLKKLIYAAYLHDMVLISRPALGKIKTQVDLERLRNISEKDYHLVLEHSSIAERSLEGIEEIPEDVLTIIKQHHETSQGTGFPNKISHQKITPLSTVFIIAHDMAVYIYENPEWKIDNFLDRVEPLYKGMHFNKVLSALRNIAKTL